MSTHNSASINPRLFYKSSPLAAKFANVGLNLPPDVELPRCLKALADGPTTLWKVFKKQVEALEFSRQHDEGLMTFAFQDWDGNRRFLSAHPVFFWFYDSNHKRPEDRRTYEVITEGAPCKLYFDLEFDKPLNQESNGVEMTDTFIKIVSYFLKEEFGLSSDRRSVLDLDSTTDSKFSRHLVFQLPNTFFRDNYNAGNFVKMICEQLRLVMHSQSGLKDLSVKCCTSEKDIVNLFVSDKHGVKKIFCDEAVYTKNRHFRIYKSTKWRKNSPLLISPENLYSPSVSKNEELPEKQLFLDSLISCTSETAKGITVLEYGQERKVYVVDNSSKLPDCPVVSESGVKSPLPVLDRFIEKVVAPGMIRRSTYSCNLKRIVYDIVGNRFCHNIMRHHKSNNVFYVVDMRNFVYYQKCYDPDCSGYRSEEHSLPPEIVFMLENEGDELFLSVSQLSDEELLDVWRAVEAVAEEEGSQQAFEGTFPEFGMSDSELLDSSLNVGDF